MQISVVGLYTTARILTPHLTSLAKDLTRKPSLLITSGGLYKDPFHKYFSLSLSKAAQFSLATTLSQRFAPEGIHVASIVVHGLVRPDSEHFSPGKIANVFWKLYEQGAKGEKEVWVTDGKGWARI
jgi:NAD(P)-dependent dehydrogenase (short-subunit alcohol dehydrogenase family)